MKLLSRLQLNIGKYLEVKMVLSLNKEKIARCFLRARESYDREAKVQNELRGELCDLLGSVSEIDFSRVLEIGCCTGGLTELICKRHRPEVFYVNDLVGEFEQIAARRVEKECGCSFRPLFGDIEQLSLPKDLNLVVSSATFQWLSNLESFFAEVSRALLQNGFLAFSLFTPGTLAEFKELTGVGLGYRSREEISKMLGKHFTIRQERHKNATLYFPTVKDILHHLQATGVGGVSEYQWSKAGLKRFIQEYEKSFSTERGLPVSYASSCYIAQKKQ